MKATASFAVVGAVIFGSERTMAAQTLSSLDTNQVSQLLDNWSLGGAFSNCFKTLGITGDMLEHDFLSADDIDLTQCPNAMPAHANKLIRQLDALKKEQHMRRRLQTSDDSSDKKVGIMMKNDGASIVMGIEEDVSMKRTDEGLHIEASNVTIDGNLYVNGEEVLTAITALEDRAAALESDLATAQSDLEAAQSDLATAQSDLEAAQDDLATAQSDLEAVEDDLASIQTDLATVDTASFCSRAECCTGSTSWDGDTLYCWAAWYDSYDEDPCSCYAVVQDLGSTTAYDHERNCIDQGAHLMSIHSGVANSAVASYGSTFWIGLHDRKNEGNFHWFDGTEMTYTSWNSGEPNDSNGEDCVHTTSDNTVWNDQDCEESLTYLGLCLWQ